jgi:heme-degrading monooxygenase HmoA
VIARMATYRASGDPNALARKAEEGILPQFRELHGFRSYSVAIDGNDVLSLSVWDTRADAEAGSEIAAEFVRTQMAGQLELIEKRFGEVAFSTTLGVSTMATATA